MEVVQNIFRIEIPFEDIYTTVFLVRTGGGWLLFDTATFPEDMDQYVFPALEQLGAQLKYVFISHNHRDHAGGLARVIEKFPGVTVVTGCEGIKEKFENVVIAQDGAMVLDCLQAVAIPGHTPDSFGLLDTRTGTLLTGDCLQAYGIFGSGNWGANITFPAEHIAALEKIRGLNVQTIIASHDYHPCGFIARGTEEIDRYLSACSGALENIRNLAQMHPDLDDEAIAEIYNAPKNLPTLAAKVISAVRRELV